MPRTPRALRPARCRTSTTSSPSTSTCEPARCCAARRRCAEPPARAPAGRGRRHLCAARLEATVGLEEAYEHPAPGDRTPRARTRSARPTAHPCSPRRRATAWRPAGRRASATARGCPSSSCSTRAASPCRTCSASAGRVDASRGRSCSRACWPAPGSSAAARGPRTRARAPAPRRRLGGADSPPGRAAPRSRPTGVKRSTQTVGPLTVSFFSTPTPARGVSALPPSAPRRHIDMRSLARSLAVEVAGPAGAGVAVAAHAAALPVVSP